MITHRQRQMLLQALTLIERACEENEEIEIALGDGVWLELDNFLNPVTLTKAEWRSIRDKIFSPIFPPKEDETP